MDVQLLMLMVLASTPIANFLFLNVSSFVLKQWILIFFLATTFFVFFVFIFGWSKEINLWSLIIVFYSNSNQKDYNSFILMGSSFYFDVRTTGSNYHGLPWIVWNAGSLE